MLESMLTQPLASPRRDPHAPKALRDHRVQLLVLSPRPDEAPRLERLLRLAGEPRFACVGVSRLRDASRRLERESFVAALVDVDALKASGLDGLTKLCQQDPRVPVLVVTSRRDDPPAVELVRRGAQDVLLRSELTPERLGLALAFGIERGRLLAQLHELTVTDPLTGLCNRRGFRLLAEAHVRLLQRSRRQSLLLYADVDGLKRVNDRHGHAAGDWALVLCARALRRALRESDIVARFGGDEFVALAFDVPEDAGGALVPRIVEALEVLARADRAPFELSLSVGTASFDRGGLSLDAILARADKALYAEKLLRSRLSAAGSGR